MSRRLPAEQATMRAAVIASRRRGEISLTQVPEPDTGQIRVRVEGSGICGSNLPVWEGRDWFEYPLPPGAPGHEAWGVVETVGEGVTSLHVGDRVAFLSGKGFAEIDVAAETEAVKIPSSLADQPVPGEALGCAVNIFRRSSIEAGQTVALVGVGFLGALLCQLVAGSGARVIAISRRRFALDLAREFGASECIVMDDHARILSDVRRLTSDRLCERVIEVTGQQWPLDLAGELTAERGRLVIAGYHQDAPRQINMQLWNWRGLDVVNAHERDPQVYVRGMREALDLVSTGRLDPRPLYTHRLPLEKIDEGFRLLAERPDGFVKALMVTQ